MERSTAEKKLTEELASHKAANVRAYLRMAELKKQLGETLREYKDYKVRWFWLIDERLVHV